MWIGKGKPPEEGGVDIIIDSSIASSFVGLERRPTGLDFLEGVLFMAFQMVSANKSHPTLMK